MIAVGLCPVINNDAIEGNISINNNPNNCSTTEEVVITAHHRCPPVSGNFILTIRRKSCLCGQLQCL